MKLIAYGKVMEDDAKTLKDYQIKENDFLVVMISKVTLLISKSNRQNHLQSQRKRIRNKKNKLSNNSNSHRGQPSRIQLNQVHRHHSNLQVPKHNQWDQKQKELLMN